MSLDYQVLKKPLDENYADYLESTFFSETFPWFYGETISDSSGDNLNGFQFGHILFRNNRPTSQHFDLVQPIFDVLNAKALIDVKVNMSPYLPEQHEGGWHTDFDFPCRSAVYYVNTNNGYTLFESGEKVSSVKNSILDFDSTIEHTGVNSNDSKARVVININYFSS
jgi:hypothetical protein